MFYQLNEDEFHNLESAMRQLGFIYDLCIQTKADDFQQLDMRGLMAFVGAQENTIRQAIDAATERDRQRSAGERIDALDVINLVKMLAGDTRHIAPDAASRILRHLVTESKDESLYQGAVEAFTAYLRPASASAVDRPSKANKPARAKASASAPKTSPIKRQKLAEGASA
jgi:hypothetical protein